MNRSIGSEDTLNSFMNRCEVLKNIPPVIDEMTKLSGELRLGICTK